jgi:D-aminoacyl-tRNA deacylase
MRSIFIFFRCAQQFASSVREILCVSQFTLYGDARKGNRPSYVEAASPAEAEPLYDRFCERLGAAKGVFGACMGVALVNDGPVTLLLES